MSADRLASLHDATTLAADAQGGDPRDEADRLLRDYAAGSNARNLPEPAPPPGTLARALAERRSTHDLRGGELDDAALSTLLAHGVGSGDRTALPFVAGGPPGHRTYPSGGGLYPVETIVASPEDCRHYQPLGHRLVPCAPPIADMQRLLNDHPVGNARVVLLLTADFGRPSLARYGGKAYRLTLLEAGHVAQNVLLVAAALGLPALPLCGFRDRELAAAAGLRPPHEVVLYALAVGGPA